MDIQLQQGAEPVAKPVRKRAVKVQEQPAAGVGGVRKWEDVVPQIREMKDAGASVPEIAEKLQLSYVLVNQVMLQSYKMTVDTVGVFDRQEQQRVAAQQQA
jgi:hypothetical protein